LLRTEVLFMLFLKYWG